MPSATTPLVSVVIPAIRHDEWLTEAIQSVLEDGYPNLEVIVVWDGDPAAQPTGLDVRIVPSGRQGTPTANNIGLSAAQGEFIARLDSDDISRPGRFAAQVRLLQDHPEAALAVANAIVIDEDSKDVRPYPQLVQTDLPHALLKSNVLVHSTFMFRAPALAYDSRCTRMQDYELALRIARQSGIVAAPEALVGYRVHGNQSGRQTTEFWKYIPVVIRARRRLAASFGVRESLVQVRRDACWFAAQYLNHKGLRDRYGSLRSVTHTPPA